MNSHTENQTSTSRFTPVHELQSFTPLTSTTSSVSPTPPNIFLPPPPPPFAPPMESPMSSPGKSPRFRPTAIVIPPPDRLFYYLQDNENGGGRKYFHQNRGEEEMEDEELLQYPDRRQFEKDSLVVLPTFYTPHEQESLVFSSNLKIPQIIIPEERIRTPRTPRTPQGYSNRKRIIQSPSDKMLLAHEQKSPSEIIKGKYKMTFPSQSFQL